ncbi:MAG: hypothetical protein DRN04_03960 [Thermoprotei archaeon]|nr:MAG: hypothetical protein DRN04_03960 [Thermoprotei archaeon]
MNMKVHGIVFDLYGTLVYAEKPISFEDLSSILLENGYEVYAQELRAAYLYVLFVDYPREKYSNFEEFFRKVCDRLYIKVDNESLKKIVSFYSRTRNKFFPEVLEVLEELKNKDLKMAVVTSVPLFAIQDILSTLKKYMTVVTSRDTGCVKPNPRMFTYALSTLSLRPEEVLSVGDDYYLDLAIPRKMGMKTALVARGYSVIPYRFSCDFILNDLKDLLRYLD